MAPKKQIIEAEPERPSVEAILTDIHNSLVEGLTAILSKLDDIHEVLAQPRVTEVAQEKGTKKVTVFLPVENGDGTKRLVEQEPEGVTIKENIDPSQGTPVPEEKKPAKAKKEKITIEALRTKISEFAEAFGMNEALAVNEQKGGSRKVSNIPEAKYAAVFQEMQDRLDLKTEVAQANEKEAERKAPVAGLPSIDDVRAAAQPFVDEYGDPAFRELLKKFGAEKISKVPPASYAALIEALTNG